MTYTDQVVQVKVGTIVTTFLILIVQTAGAVWWAATVTASVEATKNWKIEQERRIELLETQMGAVLLYNPNAEQIMQSIANEVQSGGYTSPSSGGAAN